MSGYTRVMSNAKNLHGLRQQRFVSPLAACPRKVPWGSALGLSLALPGISVSILPFAEAGVKHAANHRLVPGASS